MQRKNNKPSASIQEKRAKLIALSLKAKELRQQKKDNAKTIEEAIFWQTRTINYMLLNHIYSDGGVQYETFNEWKAQGATIKKGAKATVIWGQPRKGMAALEQNLEKEPNTVPTDDVTPEEYEFFPLCFLFSEDDVFFPNTEGSEESPATDEQQQARKPLIDSDAINEL